MRGRNAADCLARREEPYHQRLRDGGMGGVKPHEEPLRVREHGLERKLHYDVRRRLIFQAYLVAPTATVGRMMRSRQPELGSFAAGSFESRRPASMERVERLRIGGRALRVRMAKSYRVGQAAPELELRLTLESEGGPADVLLVVESNLALLGAIGDGSVGGRPLDRAADLGERSEVALVQPGAGLEYRLRLGKGGRAWYYPVETVNNSDSGYERIVQGGCLLAVHPVRLGKGVTRFLYRLRSLA